MCGIIGFSSKDKNFDIDKIKTLLYISSIERGLDATGIYSPKNGLKKTLEEGWRFVINPDNKIVPDTILLAHVRAKTVGLNEIKNAHPFERGNCVLIHNGTLKNHLPLLRKHNLAYTEYSVDSDIIAGCINKTKNITSVIKEIDGAAAFVIHDKTIANRLYVFRNKERPLYRGYIDGSMYICSIEEALKLINCTDIEQFNEDILYTIEDGKILYQTKKIKNEPHTEPSDYELRQYVGFNLRAKINMKASYEGGSGTKVKLVKGTYYEIISVINFNTFKIFDPKSGTFPLVNKAALDLTDKYDFNDYVIAIREAFVAKTKWTNPIEEGTIKLVNQTYGDGEMSFKALPNQSCNLVMTYYLKKDFRKCTKEEVDNFLASKGLINSQVQTALPITIPNHQPNSQLRLEDAAIAEFLEDHEDVGINEPTDIYGEHSTFIRSTECALEYDQLKAKLEKHFQFIDFKADELKRMLNGNSPFYLNLKSLVSQIENKNYVLWNEVYPLIKREENAY